MFTGIVEETGRIAALEPLAGGLRIWIEAERVREGLRIGDSVAVNGCCLTAARLEPGRFAVEAVPETLARTTLGAAAAGERLNLERALRTDGRLDGHFVTGHVDAVGVVAAMTPEGVGRRLAVEVPAALLPLVAEKGSIAVDGISLTVAALRGPRVEVALVPHTLEATVARDYAPGRRVNLEADLLARYLSRLLEFSAAARGAPPSGGSR